MWDSSVGGSGLVVTVNWFLVPVSDVLQTVILNKRGFRDFNSDFLNY